jgi:hypothetical protein
MWVLSPGTFVALAAVAWLVSAAVPLRGAAVLVNAHTSGNQSAPAVAMDDLGRFVVVWHSQNQDGSQLGIFGRRFDSGGAPLAVEFQVNSYSTQLQAYPAVSITPGGDFVVVWESFFQATPSIDVFARRFTSAGAAIGLEFLVNDYTGNTQRGADVDVASDGSFVVVWQSHSQDGDLYGIFGRRFSSAGGRLGVEFQVNDAHTYSSQHDAEVSVADTGFVVVWMTPEEELSPSNQYLHGRRFDSNGAPRESEFRINEITSGKVISGAVAIVEPGVATGGLMPRGVPTATPVPAERFVAVWNSEVSTRTHGSFNDSSPGGSKFVVDPTAPLDAYLYQVAVSSAGNRYLVAWSTAQGSSYRSIRIVGGNVTAGPTPTMVAAIGPETLDGDLDFPVLALRGGSGDDVLVLRAPGQPIPTPSGSLQGGAARVAPRGVVRSDTDIFLVRLPGPTALATLDVDGDGEFGSLTDALLVLRFLFGFGGSALTTGAVDADCTRCTAGDIATYIGGLGTILDIDDDDTMMALTDGLLLLRYGFGFTGATLVTGALGNGCDRCDAGDIVGYLDPLANI